MNFKELDSQAIDAHLPQFAPTEYVGSGGQKRVFKCRYEGDTWALPILLASDDPATTLDPEDDDFGLASEQSLARLRREVQIMAKCDSHHLVRMGPIDVAPLEIENLSLLYFLEEYIEGDDLKTLVARGPLPPNEVQKLGLHVALAIRDLWNCDPEHRIIHRDLKPGNIMRRSNTEDYVVLDMGLALDLLDESISSPGQVPGTTLYFTPDQLSGNKRQMDFRADMFALGVILYEAACGHHPFYTTNMSTVELFKSIMHSKPRPITDFRDDIPPFLEGVIVRLLAKKPHLRYRTCDALIDALSVDQRGGMQ